MKKRLLSLLVALCMAVTLLPVSALTAWAEGGGQLKIVDGYPVGSIDANGTHTTSCSGDGWSYDGTAKVLTLAPENPTTYDLIDGGSIRQDQNSIACSAIITGKATIVNGNFYNSRNSNVKITNYGTITSGGYLMPVINHGTIIDGAFNSAVSNESDGKIENGTFLSTVTNNGIIEGDIFSKKPDGCKVADGYTLNVESPDANTNASISYLSSSSCYIIPNYSHPTSITVRYHNPYSVPPFSIDVTIDNTQQMLLTEWAGNIENFNDAGEFHVTFTAPPATANTVTLSMLTRLVIDIDGYPVGTKGGTQDYSGNGWKFEKSNNTLTLESGDYDFSGEENALRPLNPNVQLVVESGAKLTGGAFKNEPTVKGAGTDTTDTFKKVTLNGTDSITAVNGLASGDWGNTLYVVKTGSNTITASVPILDINRILFENDDSLYPDFPNKKTVCINIESLNSVNALDPEADIILNQASHGLSLIMDNDGTPVIVNAPFEPAGGFYTYYGDGWHIQKSFEGIGRLYLTGGNTYNFRYTDPVNKKNRPVGCSEMQHHQ